MGAQQPRQQVIAFNPLSAGYVRTNNSSGDIVWTNNTTGEELEEHHFLSSNERQFNYQLDAFNFRHNSPYLVAAQYLRKNVQSDFCGSIYSGQIFLERIPIRLSQFKQIPYPDVLYLYSQAFKGFDIIQRQVGPFNINEDLIGVNNQGLVKVWVNSDFTRSLPEISSIRMTEQGMIRKIIEIVNQNTYIPTTPMNIRQFFEQRNPLTLAAAHSVLQQYAASNHVKIPSRLDCYLQAFKNQRVSNPAIISKTQQKAITHNPSLIGQTISPIVPSTYVSQNAHPSTVVNQHNISRPSTIYRNHINRSISQPHSSSVITPTQQILNSSVIHKPITTNITSVDNGFQKSRNILIRSPSKYPTNISSTLITQQPSNIIPQVNTTPLNLKNQNRSLSSPIVNRPIRTSPLFPKINTNAIRHQSLNTRPSLQTINIKNNNIGKVGQVHHLFNRKTPNILPNKVSQNITFNSQLNSKLATANINKSTFVETNRPITFRPQQVAEQKIKNSNLNIPQKPFVEQKKVTSIYQQAPKSVLKTNGLSRGIFDRIQKLNNKYITHDTTSKFGNNYNVSANNYSSAYQSTSSFTPITPLITTTTNNHATIPSYLSGTHTKFENPYHFTDQKRFETISNYNRITDVSQPTAVETQTRYYSGNNYQNQHTPASIIKNIDYESKDVAYKAKEAVQLFDIQRFTPNITEYSSAFVTTNSNNINQASGYIQSIYVPLEVNSAVQAGYLPSHAPYELNTGDLKYTQIHEQIYDNSPQVNENSYAYTSTYTQTYQAAGAGIPTTFGLNASFGQSNSPYGNAYVSQSIQIQGNNSGSPFKQSYFRQQQSTTSYQLNKISQGYQATIDQDLLSDLQKIRASAGIEGN